jgi:hypothetical protein
VQPARRRIPDATDCTPTPTPRIIPPARLAVSPTPPVGRAAGACELPGRDRCGRPGGRGGDVRWLLRRGTVPSLSACATPPPLLGCGKGAQSHAAAHAGRFLASERTRFRYVQSPPYLPVMSCLVASLTTGALDRRMLGRVVVRASARSRNS